MHSSDEMAVIVNLNYLQRSQGASTNDFPDTVCLYLRKFFQRLQWEKVTWNTQYLTELFGKKLIFSGRIPS